jgi:hypothetical protein
MASPAHFAVLQKSPGSPSIDALKRVFSSFIHLTDADAVRLAVNAQGILMRQLDRDAARAFHRALETEGIAAAMVPESELPRLPEAKSLRRVELSPEALIVHDLLGRHTAVNWNDIALVAAGAVRHFELARMETERTELRFSAVYGVGSKKVKETAHKVETDFKLVLELVLGAGTTRYQIDAAEFPFKYVIDRPELSVSEKFVWLVREICRNAPSAIFNYGARALHKGSDVMPEYASRQMLADEMVWLLWSSSIKHTGNAR